MAFNKYAVIRKRQDIFKKTNGLCIYCGCDLIFEDFHMEHAIPKSMKSGDSRERLFPCCPLCNSIKYNLTIEEFRRKLEEDIFYTPHVRMALKYHNLKKEKVVFYFEKVGINVYGK